MEKIGMIGLGTMGHSIAQNIMDHGYPMVLYDIRPEAMADLVAKGAEAAASPEELGTKVNTVLVIVNAYKHCVSALTLLFTTMHSGTVIQMSTISQEDAKSLEQMASAAGVTMLDCPVSGGSAGAKAGTLTLMAAGSDELYGKYLPLLQTFGTKIVHCGDKVGQGQAVKAINQLLVGIHMCATAEAFTLAKKCGLDEQLVYDTIRNSAGNSNIFSNRGQFLIDRDFSTRSTLAIQMKDTDIACRTGDAVGAATPLANVAREIFKLSLQKYPPTDDSLSVARLYEELSGLEL